MCKDTLNGGDFGPLASSSMIPSGIIGIWTGSLSNIPADWRICNGTGGLPDLAGRFVTGTTGSNNPGAIGGALTHTHNYYNIPVHDHGGWTTIDGSHTHDVYTTTTTSGSYAATTQTHHMLDASVGTDSTGSHTHTVDSTGSATCVTDPAWNLPPYYTVAFISNTAPVTSLPVGIIMAWTGTLANIPSGWTLCNGTNGTPDLQSRFVAGVSPGKDPGDTGGSATHTHTYSQVPVHTHTLDVNGTHSHTIVVPVTIGSSGVAPTPCGDTTTASQPTEYAGTHTHTIPNPYSATCTTFAASSMPTRYEVAFIMKTQTTRAIPTGIMAIWTRPNAQIPSGWHRCDGGTGTPDMRGYFLAGAPAGLDPSSQAGTTFHNHGYDQVPSHTHTIEANGSHWHYFNTVHTSSVIGSTTIYVDLTGHTLGALASTSAAGAHCHSILYSVAALCITSTDDYKPPYYEVSYIMYTNTPPRASNPVILLGPTVTTTQDLTMNYTYSDAEAQPNTGSIIHWYRNGTIQPQLENQTTVSNAWTNKSETWYFTVEPCDGIGYGAVNKSNNVTIINTPPSITSAMISPGTPHVNETLTLAHVRVDVDGDGEAAVAIDWYRNGTKMGSLANVTSIPASNLAIGDTWYARIKISDGENWSTVVQSNTVTILKVTESGPGPGPSPPLTIPPDYSSVVLVGILITMGGLVVVGIFQVRSLVKKGVISFKNHSARSFPEKADEKERTRRKSKEQK